mmetsp:Transcript_1295/g.1521  ORF Transcript_1295/g.1521 Transcript_1295/m.1521 type:complete len:336 (-) Transcript_1295:84-1091(-)
MMLQLDTYINWSWWLIFTPFFLMSCCVCCGNLQLHAEVQSSAEEQLFPSSTPTTTTDYGAMEEGKINIAGSTGNEQEGAPEPLTDEEKEEIKGRVFQSSSRLFSSCCSQFGFLVLLCIGIARAQGAGYSSIWIFSPFLFIASIVLCLLGCMIFCVSPIDEEDMMFDPNNPTPGSAYMNMDGNNMSSFVYTPAAQQSSSSSVSQTAPTEPQTNTTAPAPSSEPIEEPSPVTTVGDTSTAIQNPGEQAQLKSTHSIPQASSSISHQVEKDTSGTVAAQPRVEEKVVAPISTDAGVPPASNSQEPVDLLDVLVKSNDDAVGEEANSVVPTPSEVEDLD